MNYTKMATYMFCTACNNSQTSNWRVFQTELEGMFDVKLCNKDIYILATTLLENFPLAISDIVVDRDEQGYIIDFIIGKSYCLDIKEKENV